LILDQRAILDEFDPNRQIGLILDEWGTWHPPTPGRNPQHLWQQNTLRDALVAALTLDTFNRHADKLVKANIAQAANVLQALFLTEGDKLVLTPTYHVFDLYKGHQGGRGVRLQIDSPTATFALNDQRQTMPAVAGSASISGRTLTLSLTNVHARVPAEVEIEVRGRDLADAQVTTLANDDLYAHNTFERPDALVPTTTRAAEMRRVTLPPASVSVFEVELT
jgi:alpha-N-arabinofuranosidase